MYVFKSMVLNGFEVEKYRKWKKIANAFFFLIGPFSIVVFVSERFTNLYGIKADIILIHFRFGTHPFESFMIYRLDKGIQTNKRSRKIKKEIFIGCLGVHRQKRYALHKRTKYKVNASSFQRQPFHGIPWSKRKIQNR